MAPEADNAAPSYLAAPLVQYLSDVLSELVKGDLLVPRFQREFIWNEEQQLELLRSIYSGIPIGSIMVWRTSIHHLETESLIGFHVLPAPDISSRVTKTYLLDGLQRLSTLLVALVPHQEKATRARQQNASSQRYGEDYEFYYDLREEEFFILRKRPAPQHSVPTTILLSSLKLLRFQRSLEQLENSELLIARSDRLANAFRNYRIPIIPIVSNDLEDATKAFQRINSGGTRMSDTHMVAALTFSPGFDLAGLLDDATNRLAAVGWERLDRKYILATVRALQNLEIANPNAEQLSKALRADHNLVERAVECIIRAARFLKERCLIPTAEFVPYSYQAVIIAASLDETPELDLIQSDALWRWLWTTTYTAFFLGARSQNINAALKTVRRIVDHNPEGEFSSDDLVETLPARFDFRAARSKAFVIRLAELHPRNVEGQIIDVCEILATNGASAMVQLADSRLPIDTSGPENRFLYPASLWQVDKLFAEVGPTTAAFLKSHAIPDSAAALWRQHDYRGLLKERREQLRDVEYQFVSALGLRYAIT